MVVIHLRSVVLDSLFESLIIVGTVTLDFIAKLVDLLSELKARFVVRFVHCSH